MEYTPIDILWLLLCAGIVFLMQAGFLCLETGPDSTKNNINVAVKKERFLSKGMDGYVSKPLRIEMLLHTLEQAAKSDSQQISAPTHLLLNHNRSCRREFPIQIIWINMH